MSTYADFPFKPSVELLSYVIRGFESIKQESVDSETALSLFHSIGEGLLRICHMRLVAGINSPDFLTTESGELGSDILKSMKWFVFYHPSDSVAFSRAFGRCILRFAKKDYPTTPRIIIHESGRAILLPHYDHPKTTKTNSAWLGTGHSLDTWQAGAFQSE